MEQLSDMMQELRVFPCLSVLREEELSTLGQMSRLKRIQKDSALFEESAPVQFFYIIKEGTIKLFKTSEEGRELIVKFMGAGDYFCCAPLYSGGKYFVGATAVEDSTVIAIPAHDFTKMLKTGVTARGWKIITGLCNRIHYLSSLVENLIFRDVEERVILALLRMAEEKAAETDIVMLSITHQDIASMTGTVREVVSRTMSRLRKERGIVDSSIRGFTVDKRRLLKLLLGRRVSSG
jgi:CRP/FNR family cyclic AMP-dependent transcriptional regulator